MLVDLVSIKPQFLYSGMPNFSPSLTRPVSTALKNCGTPVYSLVSAFAKGFKTTASAALVTGDAIVAAAFPAPFNTGPKAVVIPPTAGPASSPNNSFCCNDAAALSRPSY